MRKIKFRAWDKERKEILPVKLMDFAEWWVSCRPAGATEDPLIHGERNSFSNSETDRHILMQFTGLKDRNGKDVYDGDVVKVLREDSYRPYVAEVYFSGGCYGTTWFDPARKKDTFEPIFSWDIEVIGNKFENLELLGES